jgi:nitrogen fixation protein
MGYIQKKELEDSVVSGLGGSINLNQWVMIPHMPGLANIAV